MSVLRQLVDEDLLKTDPARALLEAALTFRRAGGVLSLGDEITPPEVAALVVAGETLATEHALLTARALVRPEEVEELLDGGDARIRRLVRTAADAAVARLSKERGPD